VWGSYAQTVAESFLRKIGKKNGSILHIRITPHAWTVKEKQRDHLGLKVQRRLEELRERWVKYVSDHGQDEPKKNYEFLNFS
jgi:hypothetical protein